MSRCVPVHIDTQDSHETASLWGAGRGASGGGMCGWDTPAQGPTPASLPAGGTDSTMSSPLMHQALHGVWGPGSGVTLCPHRVLGKPWGWRVGVHPFPGYPASCWVHRWKVYRPGTGRAGGECTALEGARPDQGGWVAVSPWPHHRGLSPPVFTFAEGNGLERGLCPHSACTPPGSQPGGGKIHLQVLFRQSHFISHFPLGENVQKF